MAILMGLLSFTRSITGGAAFLAIALLLLPPVRKFAFSKWNVAINGITRTALIIALFFGSAFLISHDGDVKDKQEKANLEAFSKNRPSVLANLKTLLANKDYKAVIAETEKYQGSNDADLKALHDQAKDQAKEQLLLSDLSTIKVEPANFSKLQSAYQQLAELNPSSKDYKQNADNYAQKIANLKRTKRIEAQFSPYDGAHRSLEKYIKENMNDPDSYQHDETTRVDMKDYLVVTTVFRGKNGFGALVKNSVSAKVDMDGNILKIIK